MSKKVKNILISMDIEGNGIVNFDSNDQKWSLHSSEKLKHLFRKEDNVSYAKKHFFKDENGEWDYKIKISSDAIKRGIFKDDFIEMSPNVMHHDSILYNYIASPMALLRGYLFAKENETLKRKSPLTITDAVQTSNAVSSLETFSKGGNKINDYKADDKKENNFFKQESIGDVEYQLKGFIDLMGLQFISCDQVFDRYSFNPDMFDFYSDLLSKRLPNFKSDLTCQKQINSVVDIPEYGVLLNNDDVVYLVKELLTKLLVLKILRRKAYAKTKSLKIKLVYDVLEDTFDNSQNWISIKNFDDIENLDFEMELFYDEISEEVAKNQRLEFEAKAKNMKEIAKESKKQNKKSKE